jgi:hypothetical protein
VVLQDTLVDIRPFVRFTCVTSTKLQKLTEEVVLQDTLVDIRPFVRPLPDIPKSHKGALACRALRSADVC